MVQDVIFLVVLIVALLVIWLGLKYHIRVRQQKIKSIKKIDVTGYITYVQCYENAEKAEKDGDRNLARKYFKEALMHLDSMAEQDELTEETRAEVRARIARLEN